MKRSDITKLVIATGAPLLAGGIGSIFTTAKIPGWYANLAKPLLNPPSWVFGPVWTVLYVLMGVATFLVWKRGGERKAARQAFMAFVTQLFLNAIWSVLFFGLQRPDLALIDIVLLWIMIVVTMVFFARVSKTSAWLLLPYLAWVSFATYLNYGIYVRN